MKRFNESNLTISPDSSVIVDAILANTFGSYTLNGRVVQYLGFGTRWCFSKLSAKEFNRLETGLKAQTEARLSA